jgi:hypothetical protein
LVEGGKVKVEVKVKVEIREGVAVCPWSLRPWSVEDEDEFRRPGTWNQEPGTRNQGRG